MHNFKDLLVWQKAVYLAERIYQITRSFPETERFNLSIQLQKAAVSIPSNIAEGGGRNSKPSFKQFLAIALGSSYELETQLILSSRLGYIAEDDFVALAKMNSEIQKMLHGLSHSLEQKP